MSGIVSVDLNPGSIIEGLGKVIDDLFTSDEEKLQAKQALEKLSQAERLGQLRINVAEAQHRSLWVAGWRPFIGWVCGGAMAYNFILRDLIAWAFMNLGAQLSVPPELQLDQLFVVLMGLLGLGGMRTVEKVKGKA